MIIDNGAVWALRQRQKSLLPIGVIDVEGDFGRGDMVLCKDTDGDDCRLWAFKLHRTGGAQHRRQK